MARPLYSIAILSAAGFGDSSAEVTVPAGHVYVIRDISGLMAMGNLTGDLQIQVGGVTILDVPCAQRISYPFHWLGHTVVDPGTSITVTWTVGLFGFISVYLSGYDLTLP
jgi:hypothetical protein